MNWLAHVFLSEAHIEHRLGNLLADLVRGPERAAMSAHFQRGAELHRSIDAYTDAHPIVRRSRLRLPAAHRRFSGVLIDIFYDHLLASQWLRYSDEPLTHFTQRFYAEASKANVVLPEEARGTLDRIVRHDLLGAYAHIEGVEESLRRLSMYLARRWRRDFALERAAADLEGQKSAFATDFAEFFPELQTYAAQRMTSS